MASINYNDYQKNQNSEETKSGKREISVGKMETKDTQYYIGEVNVLLDFIEVDFGKQGFAVEVWMSFLGNEFKMKIDMMSKEDFEKLDLGPYIGEQLSKHLDCLKCRDKFFDDLCEMKHEGEIEEEESEDEFSILDFDDEDEEENLDEDEDDYDDEEDDEEEDKE